MSEETMFSHQDGYGNKLIMRGHDLGVYMKMFKPFDEEDYKSVALPYPRLGDLIHFLVGLQLQGRVPQAREEEVYFVGNNGDESLQIYFTLSSAIAGQDEYIDVFNGEGIRVRTLKREIDDEDGVEGQYKYIEDF